MLSRYLYKYQVSKRAWISEAERVCDGHQPEGNGLQFPQMGPRLAADEELLFSHEFVRRFGTRHKTGVGHSFSTGRRLPESFGGTTQLLYEPRQFGRLQLVPRNERIRLRSLQGIHREFCR